ncbi:MAG: hypothetical protein WC648_01065 [Candidatus Paceibacterota bacterium]|jgi:hypothetical protein
MTADPIKNYIAKLPPSTVNNSRERVREIYKKSQKERYGGHFSREIEEITGEPSDRTGYDTGSEPERR